MYDSLKTIKPLSNTKVKSKLLKKQCLVHAPQTTHSVDINKTDKMITHKISHKSPAHFIKNFR